ncbi:phage tail tape measure protein [Deinococcus aquaticus]|uniref:Phage tail tape measure protein domain-containing protein n=1 Tax=Deinococcus aquaticus TaxID=328692 RepID=A0ABY7UZ61_9DEIO|nr:phage tail tape measure protein [Deinococcus aquaticus]WDA58168.1 hypothetical protein M8445_12535 [Deinococcus aquaticus]
MQDLLRLSVEIGANISGLQNGLNQAQNSVNQFSNETANAGAAASQSLATSGIAIAAGIAASVGVAIGAITSVSAEAHKAQNQLQASLGLTAEEAKQLGVIAKDVFKNNFGASIGEVTASLGTVRGQLKGLSDEDLKNATENAYRLKDVFGVEIVESVDAVKTLMNDFGLSQKEANDFITKGMQSGLNASGDFLDTIGEYSNQFAGMKLSSGEFFSALQTGLKGGVLGTDKIADSFKEFGIRIIDGSKTTTDALGELNISAKQVSEELASGEMTKGDAFKLIQERLSRVNDQVKQNAIGVSLFGTQWEDIGGKAILAVDLQKTAMEDMKDATSGLDIAYNDLGSAVQGVGRQLVAAFMPIGDSILNLLNSLMPYIKLVTDGIATIGDAFNALPTPIQNTVTALALVAGAVSAGVAIYGTVSPMLAGVGASFTALKTTMLGFAASARVAGTSIAASISAAMWPIALAVAAIGGLYLAYRNNFLGIRDFLKPMIANIVTIVGKVVDGIKYVVYNSDMLWKAFLKSLDITSKALGSIVKGIGTILSGVGLIIYAAFIEPFVSVFAALNTASAGILNGLKSLVNNIANVLRPVFAILEKMGIALGQSLQQALNSVGGFVSNLFGGAAADIQAQANAAAKSNSTFGKGLDKVEAGWNSVTGAVNGASAAYRSLASNTQAAMKTPPNVQVQNVQLPAKPVSTGVPAPVSVPVNTPASTGYSGNIAGADVAAPKTTSAGKTAAPFKATAEDIAGLSTEIKRLVEDQQRLVKTGKVTEDQAIAYARKVEDLRMKIDKLNLESNKNISAQYNQAKSLITSTNATATAAKVKADADAKAKKAAEDRKKAEELLNKEIGKLGASVKDMSDADIASTIERLAGRSALGDVQKLAILQAEAESRATERQDAAQQQLNDSLEEYFKVVNKTGAAIADFNDSADGMYSDARRQAVETSLADELSLAGDNESAKLEIKKKYLAQLLELDIAKLEDESNAKAGALSRDYTAALAEASALGIDTNQLTQSYLNARLALQANSESAIAAIRSKNAREIAEDEMALNKKVVEERVRINKEAAKDIIDAATKSIDTSSIAGLTEARQVLENLRSTISSIDSESLTDLDDALSDIDKNIQSIKASALSGVNDVIESTAELSDEFDKLGVSLSPKEKYVSDGVAAYDALIEKYDDALERLKLLREVFERTDDVAGMAMVDAIVSNTTNAKSSVVSAKSEKSGKLGGEFDSKSAAARDKMNADIASKELQLVSEVSSFKLSSLDTEKNAKLALAKTDEEKALIELAYIGKIKDAKLKSIADAMEVKLSAIESEKKAELEKEGLTQEQTARINALYEAKKQLVIDSHRLEREEIGKTAKQAEEAQNKQLSKWKELLQQFIKDMASAVGSAYASISSNNANLADSIFNTPEDKAKAEGDTANANAGAYKDAGTSIFSSAMTLLSKALPEFSWLIELVSGLFAKMPQLGIIFQRVGEMFLLGFSLLEPVINMLATVLEPLLNIMKVMMEAIIKPLLPILTFFVEVVGGIIKAVYGVIKTVWNTVAAFLNSINILGWKPFSLSMLPELSADSPGTAPIATPAPPTGGSTSGSGSGSNNTVVNDTKTSVTINVSGNSDPNEIARLVEKKLIKSLR